MFLIYNTPLTANSVDDWGKRFKSKSTRRQCSIVSSLLSAHTDNNFCWIAMAKKLNS